MYRRRTRASYLPFSRWLALSSAFGAGWAFPSNAQAQRDTAVVGAGGPACAAAVVVHVDVATNVYGCPSDVDVAYWVNALTGRESAIGASRTADGCAVGDAGSPDPNDGRFNIWVRVELAQPDSPSVSPDSMPAPHHVGGRPSKHDITPAELAAFIVALPSDSAPPRSSQAAASSALPVRTLVQRVACDELLRVAALSISLLVDSEPPLPEANATTANSDLSGANILPQPNDREPASPQRSVPSEIATPNTNPPTTVSPEPPSDAVATSSPSLEDWEPYPVFGVRGHVGLGPNPAVNGGGAASLGVGVAQWWFQAYASFSTSAKRTLVRENGLTGYVRAATWTFGVEPCLTVANSLGVCVDAGYNSLDAEGRGFDVDRSEVVRFWSAGASGTYYWPLAGSLRGSVGLGVTLPLTRVTMSVSGVSDPIWQMPPLSGRVAAGIDWR